MYYINGTEWKKPNAVAVTSSNDDDNDILWIILLIWVIVLTIILIILIIVLCCIRRKYYMVRKGAFSSANSDFSATWGSSPTHTQEKKKNGDLDINVNSSAPTSPVTPTAPTGRPVSNISDIQTGWMGTLKGDHETEYETGTIKDEKKDMDNPPPAAAFMNVDESFIDPTDSLKRAAKAKKDREEADNKV